MFRGIKRGISLILVITMMLTLFTFNAGAASYPDKAYWATEALDAAVKNKILYGRENGDLDPEANLLRAEMAAIVVRAFGATVEANISGYPDMKKTAWYYDEVAKAVHMGAFIGNENGLMKPEDFITREEVFTVLARLLVLESSDFSSLSKFKDNNEIGDWAKKYISALTAQGYVNGNELGNVTPKANITRAEFAQLMHNLFKNYFLKEGTYNSVVNGGAMINVSGVTLKDITINGDLVIGDGVGYGTVTLDNVTITGRLICRGGSKVIKLINTKVGKGVVINNVNGVVNFDNYRSDDAFKNIIEKTKATFKKKTGGSGSYTPVSYHTVKFFNGVDSSVAPVATVYVRTDLADGARNIASAGRTLASIYSAYRTDETQYTYTYDRASMATQSSITEPYTHKVEKSYTYYKVPENQTVGTWEEFTDTTDINGDINVFFALKGVSSKLPVTLAGIDVAPAVFYDYNSRFMNSVKDALIPVGVSLESAKTKVDKVVKDKYKEIYNKTGLIDENGNILDKDFDMKIVDVISYENIEKEVQKYINGMLNGNEDDLRNVLTFFSIPELVDIIGARKLLDGFTPAQIREFLKDPSFAPLVAETAADVIIADSEGTLITSVLSNTDAKNALIDSIASNDKFIASLMDIPYVQTEVLSILKTEDVKAKLSAIIDNPDVTKEIVNAVKKDSGFKDKLTYIVSDEQLNEMEDEEADAALKKMNEAKALRKTLVSAVAEPGKVYIKDTPENPKDANGFEYMTTQIAKDLRNIVIKIVKAQDAAIGADLENIQYAYEALIKQYVDGSHDFQLGVTIGSETIKMVDDGIIDAIVKYFDGVQDDTGLSTVIDNAVTSLVPQYAKDYIAGKTQNMDPIIISTIENSIFTFVKGYFAGLILQTNEEVKTFANTVKTLIISTVKSTSIDKIMEPIISYVTDESNRTFIVNFIKGESYPLIVAQLNDNSINTIKGQLSDNQIKKIAENVTVDMIVTHIGNLEENDRINLANMIVAALNEYPPFVKFMEAFKNKEDTFEINKSNLAFVSGVGEAINGFDYDEIKGLLNQQGFGAIIDMLGKDQDGKDYVEGIFNASKKAYWDGLKPLVEDVKNSSEADIKKYYTTHMNMTINLPVILRGIYENKAQDFKNKINAIEDIEYTANTSLVKLTTLDWFEMYIGYDSNRVNETTGVTGYYLKDYTQYYASILDTLIVFDNALCYYDTTNYDKNKLIKVKKAFSKQFIDFLTSFEELPGNIENNLPIVGDLTLNELVNKVNELETFINNNGAVPGMDNIMDKLRAILTDLGAGELPNGYTVGEFAQLSSTLKNAVSNMNEAKYEEANTNLKNAITNIIEKIQDICIEINTSGTVNGKPVEVFMSKLSILNKLYTEYTEPVKNIIKKVAEFDLSNLDLPINTERIEEIVFGREEAGNIFNIDTLLGYVQSRIPDVNNIESGRYVIERINKITDPATNASITFERFMQ